MKRLLIVALLVSLAFGAKKDKTPPVVSIVSPKAGAVLSGIVPIQVTATDNVGVTLVTMAVVNGPQVCSLTMAPYACAWNSVTDAGVSRTITVTARDAAGNKTSKSVTVTAAARLVVTTSFLPSGVQGQPYTTTLVATGGITPYLWSISSGSLPVGLSLSQTGSSAVISGTPTTDGTFNVVVSVQDAQPSQMAFMAFGPHRVRDGRPYIPGKRRL